MAKRPETIAERTARRLRVTVLAGGPSAERAVSLDSGRAVAAALRARGHDVRVCDIGPDNLGALSDPGDVVFPALHGTFGEDGQVQREMARRGIRFVGCDAACSQLAIDKVLTKQAVSQIGVPTPEFVIIESDEQALSAPCVIKPVSEGSSVGVVIAHTDDERDAAIRQLAAAHSRLLIERFVAGDEVTVGVLAGQCFPPITICPADGFYDYDAKYVADDTQYVFDKQTAAQQELLMRASARVFAHLGCRHLARIDWIIDGDGNAWFLEVNTMPGFTAHSLLPKAAQRAGVDFEELVDRLVHMALED
jgi:D-alanine-D-alanine ligase